MKRSQRSDEKINISAKRREPENLLLLMDYIPKGKINGDRFVDR